MTTTRSVRSLASWLVLLLGGVLTLLAWSYVSGAVEEERREYFERRTLDARGALEQLLRVHSEILRGLQGLFTQAPDGTVDRAAFGRYAANVDLQGRYPGIQAVFLMRYLRSADAAAFVQQVRQDVSVDPAGYPDFAIRPAGVRDEYFVVDYVESADPQRAFGLDLGVEPVRRAALERARDLGVTAATGRIQLYMEPDAPTAFTLAAPVYRPGASLETVAERRAAFLGCVAIVFRMNDLMRGVFGNALLRELDVEIYDGDAGRHAPVFSNATLLFDSALELRTGPHPLHANDPRALLRKVETLDVGGRQWALVYTALPGMTAGAAEGFLPPLVLGGGLALTALLFVLTRSLAASKRLAEQAADRMAGDLRVVEERYTRLVESLDDVVWSLSLPGFGFSLVSSAVEGFTGYPPARFREDPAFWPTIIHPEDRERTLQVIHAVPQVGSGNVECRIVRADGEVRWVEVRARLAGGTAGVPLRIDGISVDVTTRRLAEGALRDSEEKLRTIFESAADGIIIADANGAIISVNKRAEALFGYGRDELIGQPVEVLVPHCLRQGHQAGRRDYAHDRRDRLMGRDVRALRKDGSEFVAEITLSTVQTKDGPLVTSIVRDTTEARRLVEMLRLRERAIASSHNGIMISDAAQPDEPIIYVNPAFERITGYAADEVLGRNGRFLLGDDREQPELEEVRAALREQREGQAVLRNYRKDGRLFWNELSVAPVPDESGRVTHFVGILNDVTERKRYEAELEYQTNRDSLTGLANRNLLHDRLAQAFSYARRYERQIAVAFIDLDHFKVINDSLGYAAGDALLRAVAERLGQFVREGDTVARLGGDEFVMILFGVDGACGLTEVLQRILDAVSRPFLIDGNELFVSCSLGATLHPQDGQDGEALLRNAEIAMYRAKEQGRNGFRFYTAEMNAAVGARLTLDRELHHALTNGEFVLHYQPQVDLASGQITGAEALIRWHHPQRGTVPPGDFIPLAEENGLIVPIGEWVLDSACAQSKAWIAAGLRPVPVAVNLSARQFRQPGLVEMIARAVRRHELPPELLELELTESMVMQHSGDVVAVMREIRRLGVSLSLDDFGTGYSSLSRLKHFPINTLKIDRAFVRDITSNPDDAVIAMSVISLAHALNRRVIAEGVETEAQLAYLRERHCDAIQGYFFSPPVPAEAFAAMLAAQKSLDRKERRNGQRTLLLVDDEANVLKALARVLRQDNYRILTAISPFEAFELLALNKVQVIISDQRMPAMNGTEFLSRVKDLHPETVRIVLSGYTDLQTVTDAINHGAIYRFLTKPWEDDALRENVREAFRRYESQTEPALSA